MTEEHHGRVEQTATRHNSFGKGDAMLKHRVVQILVVIVALTLAACASDKEPAEKALRAAEDAVNAALPDATKYVPDQAKAVQDSLRSLKDSMAKGDYKAVLAGAGDLSAKATALSTA